ncbi:MAG: hypothetical protein A2X59_04450 [Nitrospirae bacterium GWC2_42_7]|nr:MAG: hypothetical protein A2X59_04450 [Nitrospirae bacterium GWC2_42_7]
MFFLSAPESQLIDNILHQSTFFLNKVLSPRLLTKNHFVFINYGLINLTVKASFAHEFFKRINSKFFKVVASAHKCRTVSTFDHISEKQR